MKKFDAGKWAEKETASWLESRSQQDVGFAWHRFPDARAAMGRLSAQPSDFLVSLATTSGNRTAYLEVKETAQERRLPKSKVGQYGLLRKFYWTKAEVMVLIYMSAKKKWCYLQADQYVDDLFHYEDCPASFPIADLPTYDTAAEALESFF
jgi:hypothetical protein